MANQIFFKNMKGKGTFSWRDTRVTPSDTCDTAFLAHFLKNAFYALSVEWAILTKFTEPNCSTETAVCCKLLLFQKYIFTNYDHF